MIALSPEFCRLCPAFLRKCIPVREVNYVTWMCKDRRSTRCVADYAHSHPGTQKAALVVHGQSFVRSIAACRAVDSSGQMPHNAEPLPHNNTRRHPWSSMRSRMRVNSGSSAKAGCCKSFTRPWAMAAMSPCCNACTMAWVAGRKCAGYGSEAGCACRCS